MLKRGQNTEKVRFFAFFAFFRVFGKCGFVENDPFQEKKGTE